jgi:hypothetical protein
MLDENLLRCFFLGLAHAWTCGWSTRYSSLLTDMNACIELEDKRFLDWSNLFDRRSGSHGDVSTCE